MGKNKLEKFAEMASFPHVYECFDPKDPRIEDDEGNAIELAGNWNRDHFGRKAPVVLELACGRGEYTLAMAARFPDRHFIGVDIKGARIWKGAKKALKKKLDNAAFLRTRIETIATFFAKDEVSEIWITFPDPFIKKSKVNRRLSSPHFLNIYRKFLQKDGPIHLKTDSDFLYRFTLDTIEEEDCRLLVASDDIDRDGLPHPMLSVQTYYERMHREEGKSIKYVSFTL